MVHKGATVGSTQVLAKRRFGIGKTVRRKGSGRDKFDRRGFPTCAVALQIGRSFIVALHLSSARPEVCVSDPWIAVATAVKWVDTWASDLA